MKQIDIFKNHTKGEWSFADFKPQDRFEIYSDSSRTVIAKINYNDVTGKNIEHEANAELICLMKRETIDKGINPESAEKMKEVLSKLLKKASERWRALPANSYEKELLNEARGALTAAALK